MIYAHVKNGIVVNVSVWDGETDYQAPDDETLVLLGDDVVAGMPGIGWTYNPKATVNKWVDNRPIEEDL
jgi:hypothetical protein